jgi:MoxR-like ATPase
MRQELRDDIADLEDLAQLLKHAFVSKDRLIELMVTSAIAQEHLLAVGPPGTAKSELVKRFSLLCSPRDERRSDGKIPYFEYLLTRFTEPAELFGPVDVKTFQEGGRHHRITAGMLPQAEIAFLDEVFKANSAILNALLTVLNERVFYNGGEPERVPLVCAIAATNEVPDDPTLAALYDRFLVRVWTDNVEEASFGRLFQKGWQLEKDRIRQGYGLERIVNVTTTDALRRLYRALDEVDLSGIRSDYREVVRRIRAEGVELSDRRVIKLLKLIAASALRRRSKEAHPSDFWVLQHVWNDPEQIPHLRTIIEPYLEDYAELQQSSERALEDIANDINLLAARYEDLETDADYADFLQQANRQRHELLSHSDEEGREPLMERLEELIEAAMALLETKP